MATIGVVESRAQGEPGLDSPPMPDVSAAREAFGRSLFRVREELIVLAEAVSAPLEGGQGRAEALGRKLHGAFASAQVHRMDEVAGVLRGAVDQVNQVREGRVSPSEFDVGGFVERLHAMDASTLRPSDASTVAPPAAIEHSTEPSTSSRPSAFSGAPPRISTLPPAPGTEARRPYRVLVVDRVNRHGELRGQLPLPMFEPMFASDPIVAMRLAHTHNPDVVVCSTEFLDNREGRPGLLESFAAETVTRLLPVVSMGPAVVDASARDVDASVPVPCDAATLQWAIADVAGMVGSPHGTLGVQAAAENLDARWWAGHMNHTFREALGTPRRGLEVSASGDPFPDRMTLWRAADRVRQRAVGQGGVDRWSLGVEGRRMVFCFAPAVSDDTAQARLLAGGSQEYGRHLGNRIALLLAPPVVKSPMVRADARREGSWLGDLGKLFREVKRADTGDAAFEAAAQDPPDLLVGDGRWFQDPTTSWLQRWLHDPVLREVPVVVVEEQNNLSSGVGSLPLDPEYVALFAAGVLAPLTALEEKLGSNGRACGRLSALGPSTVTRSARATLKNGVLVFRSAGGLLELGVRDGKLTEAIHTGSDGAFARGAEAVKALFQEEYSRYSVDVDVDRPGLGSLRDENLDHALRDEIVRRRGWLEPLPVEESTAQLDADVLVGLVQGASSGLSSAHDTVRTTEEELPGGHEQEPAWVGEHAATLSVSQDSVWDDTPLDDEAWPAHDSGEHSPDTPTHPGGRWLRYAWVTAAALGLGYWGWRLLEVPPSRPVASDLNTRSGPVDIPAPQGTMPVHGMGSDSWEGDENTLSEGKGDSLSDTDLTFGEVLPYVEGDVAPDEGVLRVSSKPKGTGKGEPIEVRVDGRAMGHAPLSVPMKEGRHEVVFQQGRDLRYRYLFIRHGETRVVRADGIGF